jgi:threonine dehydratase
VISIDDVERAARTIAGRVHRTGFSRSATLSERLGAEVVLKEELFQRTGSFKVRGALNRIAELTDDERARGVISISAGNHAQALAWAAREAGLDALVVMWQGADDSKVAATRGYGAAVDQEAPDPTQAFDRLDVLMAETGRTLVHPFNDPAVIAGQGTVGLEILEEREAPDVVVVPVGGGGLISALEAGRSVPVTPRSAADALNAPFAGENSVEICRTLGVESVLVSEEELFDAFRWLYARTKFAAELGAAASTAALLSGKVQIEPGQTVVAVVSGGNIAAKQAAAILDS